MSAVSMGRIVRMALGRHAERSMIAVLGAFFDDSGTHLDSPVVAIGGLLGTEDQWDQFAPRWDTLLREPLPGRPPIKQFHLSPLRGGYKEFEQFSREERDQINGRFKQIILDVGLVTLAAAVDRKAWNDLIVGPLKEEFGKPEEFCFLKCVDSVVQTIRIRRSGEPVWMFFDQGIKPQFEVWARLLLSQKDKYPEVVGFTFAEVSKVVALQGADLIATETYKFGQAWLKNRENPEVHPQFSDFIYRDLSGGMILAREHIEEMIARFRERRQATS